MRFHQIDVDDDVFAYLQGKAVAFVDQPNDVLRRELLGRSSPVPARPNGRVGRIGPDQLPDFPIGTPAALSQILWVTWLVKRSGCSRMAAIKIIAARLKVTKETVQDKYGSRQLGLNARRFDVLLHEPGSERLESVLSEKFPEHSEAVRSFFSELRLPSKSVVDAGGTEAADDGFTTGRALE